MVNYLQRPMQQTFNNAVKMTASVSFKARHMVLIDGSVLQKVRDIKRQKEENELVTAAKRQEVEVEIK